MKRDEEPAFSLCLHAGQPCVVVTSNGTRRVYSFADAAEAVREFELCCGRPVAPDQRERFVQSVAASRN